MSVHVYVIIGYTRMFEWEEQSSPIYVASVGSKKVKDYLSRSDRFREFGMVSTLTPMLIKGYTVWPIEIDSHMCSPLQIHYNDTSMK